MNALPRVHHSTAADAADPDFELESPTVTVSVRHPTVKGRIDISAPNSEPDLVTLWSLF